MEPPAPEYFIVGIISKLLTDLVERNDQVSGQHLQQQSLGPAPRQLIACSSRIAQLPLVPAHVTPFHSSRPPAISVKAYLEDRCVVDTGPSLGPLCSCTGPACTRACLTRCAPVRDRVPQDPQVCWLL